MARPWTPPRALGAWRLCLGLCTYSCAGLRARSGAEVDPLRYVQVQYPEGPEEKPIGRHIQYLWLNIPHGLTDRLKKYIRPLAALGSFHNATVHIKGGANGAQLWLDPTHSEEVAKSWGRYFNLRANGGNPWHELVNFRDCKTLNTAEHPVDMWALFDDGSLCVNLVAEITLYQRPKPLFVKTWNVPVSWFVQRAADQFLERYAVEQEYGSVHIRRCDRLEGNQDCTAPQRIYEQIAQARQLKTWLFFMYAEEGYRQKLRDRLTPLGVKLLFEDEVVLNDIFPKDNYFTYLMGKYLNGGARMIVETHMCGGRLPKVYDSTNVDNHGIFLTRSTREDEVEDTYLAAEEEYAAVCSNRTKGARLLINKTSQQERKHSATGWHSARRP